VGGNVSIPAILRFTRGLPSVEATAIPPRFAVVSLETSLPKASVLNPITISESLTVSVSVNNVAVVPPIVILPLTFKLRLI
jgi:hypothetical protein